MASLFDLPSGSSDSEDDADYVPTRNSESDSASDDEDCNNDVKNDDDIEGPAQKKVKLGDKSDKEPSSDLSKSATDVWNDFLASVKKDARNQPALKSKASTSDNMEEEGKVEQEKPPDSEASNETKDDKSAVKISESEDKPVDNVDEIKLDNPTFDKKELKPSDEINTAKPVDQKKLVKVDVAISKPRSGGLGSFLSSLSKNKKPTVLQKSLADWEEFKEKEGIKEDLQSHNKGRDGFLERQRFLQRSDLRAFENEKSIRKASRK